VRRVGWGAALLARRAAFDLLEAVLRHPAPLVVDADGLNGLALREELAQACAGRTAPTLLTPHAGEAARLLKVSVDDIQARREQATRELAASFNAWVVLKGTGSVLA
jgi:NAD(P)H-hydrate repair Nnr-like enzyme with NAD(P)H-hydrate dehydratase domain